MPCDSQFAAVYGDILRERFLSEINISLKIKRPHAVCHAKTIKYE